MAGQEHLIIVMGETGAGKTSFINEVTGSTLRVGHGLESCTSEVHLSNPIRLQGQQFILVDTPGFNDTTRTDADILMEISVFLGKSHKQKKQIAGVVYLHDITNIRMRGTAVRNIKMFKEAVGDYAADNVVIVTTKWPLVEKNTGDERHEQLGRGADFFLPLLDHGATMVKNDEVPADEIFAAVVAKPLTVPLQLPYELVDKKKKVIKTSVGDILSRDLKRALTDAKSRYKQQEKDLKAQKKVLSPEELKRLKAEIKQAKEEKAREVKEKNAAINQKVSV